MNTLAPELATSLALVVVTVLMHLVGLDILLTLTGAHVRRFRTLPHIDRLIVPLGVVFGLFVLHGLEIWVYALTYHALGAIPTVEEAVYYATSAYTTLGEAGGLLPKNWRVVGALESINGSLLVGWSIALMFQVISRLLDSATDEDHRVPRGAIPRATSSRRP